MYQLFIFFAGTQLGAPALTARVSSALSTLREARQLGDAQGLLLLLLGVLPPPTLSAPAKSRRPLSPLFDTIEATTAMRSIIQQVTGTTTKTTIDRCVDNDEDSLRWRMETRPPGATSKTQHTLTNRGKVGPNQ
uniref:Uncharacterized protein n=1 Tax=Trichuris muris TaxID=70415 RepID=A0A5S6QC91_TRIMR